MSKKNLGPTKVWASKLPSHNTALCLRQHELIKPYATFQQKYQPETAFKSIIKLNEHLSLLLLQKPSTHTMWMIVINKNCLTGSCTEHGTKTPVPSSETVCNNCHEKVVILNVAIAAREFRARLWGSHCHKSPFDPLTSTRYVQFTHSTTTK